jgi:hypothetical protein
MVALCGCVIAVLNVGLRANPMPGTEGKFSAADFNVSAKILDAGLTEDGCQAFVVEAEVRNSSVAPIEIAMMTCSWNDSWLVEPQTDYLIRSWDCDSNFPTVYTFAPGGGFRFRFTVEAQTQKAEISGKKIKLGFACVAWSEYRSQPLEKWGRVGTKTSERIAWSAELSIPKSSDHRVAVLEERKELPKQSPLQTPASVTPPPGVPVAPPSRAGDR